jgi:hypothetical protein
MPLEADVRNTVSYGVSGTGKTGTYRGPPAPPSNFVSTATSPTEIDHSWDPVSDASSYLLIANEGSPVSFTPDPSASSTYTAGNSVSDGVVVYNAGVNGSVVSPISHTVSINSTYHYALYSYNGSEYSIVASTNVVSTLDCSDTTDGEWIRVPGNVAYEGRDFCVMKYEAKQESDGSGGFRPSSTSAGTPWVDIKQKMSTAETTATSACESIGAQLISNDQWMTIATNIANQGNNWDGGIVGTNSLNRGNTGDSVQEVSNVNDACDATGASSCTPTSGWHTNRRTHTLSNGEVIWDMAGNVWEWTSDYDRSSGKANPGSSWVEFNTISDGISQLKTDFIPQVAIDSSWNSAQGIGNYYAGPDNSGGALIRGGDWGGYLPGTSAGVFAAILNNTSSTTSPHFGFRCVRL